MTEITKEQLFADPDFAAADAALKRASQKAVEAALAIGEEPVVHISKEDIDTKSLKDPNTVES